MPIRICRPGWPPRWIVLRDGSQNDLEECIHSLAGLWNTDEAITMAAWTADVMFPDVVLLDEVSLQTAPKRLSCVMMDTFKLNGPS